MNAMRPVFVFAVTALLAACDQRPAAATAAHPGPTQETSAQESPATTRQVMLAMTVPTSNAVFAAAGEAPTDDAAWALAESNAVILEESARMLKTGSRAVDQQNWQQFADALISAAEGAVQAAHEKSGDKLSASSDAIYQTCETCHKQYLIPKSG